MKMKSILLSLAAVLYLISGKAQDTFTVMSYNVLNFPLGDMPNRQDTLAVILDHVQPDLLLLQELKTNTGLQSIVGACNEVLDGNYVSGNWVIQVSNPAGTWKLQQSLVYDTDRFTLLEQHTIVTPIRDINEFLLVLHDENWASGENLTKIYVFVTHLKSSQGADNEISRNESAQVFTEYLSTLPSDAMVMFGGDFNVYTSSEDAYQELIDQGNAIMMVDPIDSPGNWHDSSFPDKHILTQSTRSSQIYGDGAGGGIDDRFDFVLLSENMTNGGNSVEYVDGSYLALGNNGICYNDNILDCDQNNPTPSSVISALYYMSDHLPVIFDVESSIPFSQNELSQASDWVVINNGIVRTVGSKNSTCQVYSLDGKLLVSERIVGQLDLKKALSAGMYVLVLNDALGRVFSGKVVVE